MIELKTSSSNDNDKYNTHHKYTLDEALQAVLEVNEPTTTCFVTDPLQQKQLDDTDVSNSYLLFRSY